MYGSGRQALPDVRKARPDIREWSGTLPDVQERPGHLPGCPGVYGKPSRMSGSCWEALQDVREWLGCRQGCLGVVGRPSRMFVSG